MSGCGYIGTLCDAESLTERRGLPVTDVPNAITYFIELEVKPEECANFACEKIFDPFMR